MTEAEAAYLAGIIDGEGNIAISRRPAKPQCGEITDTFLDYVKITNVDIRLVEWLVRVVGAGTVYKEKRTKDNSRQVYTWHISGQKCQDMLRVAYPFLVIKKEQADCLFEFRKTYEKRNCKAGLPRETLRKREGWHDEIARLHHVEFA